MRRVRACKPNETQRLRGWFSFDEGDDIDAELQRINATKWQQTSVALAGQPTIKVASGGSNQIST